MKTENDKTMKTRISQILFAAIFTLIMLAGNVNAKGTELIIASSLENEVEATLELEDWMINDNCWMTNHIIQFIDDVDNELTLENWMSDETVWTPRNIETEKETEMDLEPWMINANYWKG